MARKEINIFSVSFLDCIFCGFGAVVLLFVLINARANAERVQQSVDLRAAVQRLQQHVLDQRKDRIVVRNSIDETEEKRVLTQGMASRIQKELEEKTVELARYEDQTLATREHVNRLKADLKSLEEDYKRLQAAALDAEGGTKIKSFTGDGDRQYLTGVKMGGERILLLVDASASMLAREVVDVIIRRNLPDDAKRNSPKWQQAVSTVDWLTAQFPKNSRFQIYLFNEAARPLIPGTGGSWLDATDPVLLRTAMDALRQVVPEQGTSLYKAFEAIHQMDPPPDNCFLLVDSLPTMGSRPTRAGRVSGKTRIRHFEGAVKLVPRRLPMNIILFPMEGDPMASSAYWRLAANSDGSFFSPSEDWP